MARIGVWPGHGPMRDLHQPTFDLDERALPFGVRVLTQAALTLRPPSPSDLALTSAARRLSSGRRAGVIRGRGESCVSVRESCVRVRESCVSSTVGAPRRASLALRKTCVSVRAARVSCPHALHLSTLLIITVSSRRGRSDMPFSTAISTVPTGALISSESGTTPRPVFRHCGAFTTLSTTSAAPDTNRARCGPRAFCRVHPSPRRTHVLFLRP